MDLFAKRLRERARQLELSDAEVARRSAGWPLVPALVGFNLGVEVGQAAAVALPLLLYVGSRH